MKNIIVPIDFSEYSLKGLDMAVLLSKKTPVNIQMVYIQKSSSDYSPGNASAEKDYADSKFKKILKEYEPKLSTKESKLRYIIKKGKIFQEIVDQAESYKDCMIFMSTHGASGFERYFIGSNAFKILSATECPVLALRKGKCPKSIKKIVVPVKLSNLTRQKIPMVIQFAKLYDAEVHLVLVTSSAGKRIHERLHTYEKQIEKNLKQYKIKTVKKFIQENKKMSDNRTEEIVKYASSVKADMIAIVKEPSGLFIGDYAQEMLNTSTIPVLVIHPKSKYTRFTVY